MSIRNKAAIQRSKEQKTMTAGGQEPTPKPQAKVRQIKRSKYVEMREFLQERFDFRFDEFALEYQSKEKNSDKWKAVQEHDIFHELYEAGFTGIKDMAVTFLHSTKHVPRYNPLKEYMDKLPKWNNAQPDYITELARYVNVKDSERELFDYHFKKMLVRALACALDRIDFNKHCFTLKGKQNDGKSTFLRFLLPSQLSKYSKENLDLTNKDGRVELCKNIFINLDEVDSFNRKEAGLIKNFITIDYVKERLPYDKGTTRLKRIASFVGSTNKDEFLRDETGSVRWLVFAIEGIQHDNGGPNGYNQNINIDLVYSQALYLLDNGFKYLLTVEDIKQSEDRNRRHQVQAIEHDLIQQHFDSSTKDEFRAYDNDKVLHNEGMYEGNFYVTHPYPIEFLTTSSIIEIIDEKNRHRLNATRIGKALKYLGFERQSKRKEGGKHPVKGYYVKLINETQSI